MCKSINLEDVALVLYDYWPEDCIRVRSALEAMAHRGADDDAKDFDVSFADDAEADPPGRSLCGA